MKTDDYRALALELPGAEENEHHGHPDFRVGGKIFATIGPDGDWGMVKLDPAAQEAVVTSRPDVFEPIPGAWGRRGCTRMWLAKATKTLARRALKDAWRNTAPKRLLREHGEDA